MPPKKRGPETKRMSLWEKNIRQELEKRRQREEHLKRELAATRKNYKVVETTWRKILRKVQTPLIKGDAQALWRRFEHTVDIKDRVIVVLQQALDEDEEQTFQSQIYHSEILQQLLGMYIGRLADLRQRNQDLVEKLCEAGRRFIVEQTRKSSKEIEQQHILNYTTKIQHGEYNLQFEADIHAKLEDNADKLSAQIQLVRASLETKLEKIWDQVTGVIEEYQKRTADIHKAYLRLKERDELHAVDVHRNSERTQSLQVLIKNMHDQERRTKVQQASLDGLKEERKDFINVYSRLRDHLLHDRASDTKRLKELVRQSNESLKELSEIERKGERILSLADVCQNMQTEFETVIVNGERHFTEEMTKNFSEPGQEIESTHVQPFVKEAVETSNELAIFWRRVGRAQVTRNVLAEEYKSLKAQNKELRAKLCDYLTRVRTYATSKPASNQYTTTKGFAIIEASHVYKQLI